MAFDVYYQLEKFDKKVKGCTMAGRNKAEYQPEMTKSPKPGILFGALSLLVDRVSPDLV